MSHALRMLAGCIAAFGLLFLLPLLGVGSGVTLFVFIVAMFLCHALMMLGHGHSQDKKEGMPSQFLTFRMAAVR